MDIDAIERRNHEALIIMVKAVRENSGQIRRRFEGWSHQIATGNVTDPQLVTWLERYQALNQNPAETIP